MSEIKESLKKYLSSSRNCQIGNKEIKALVELFQKKWLAIKQYVHYLRMKNIHTRIYLCL